MDRDSTAAPPNQFWVTHFTFVAIWPGPVYIGFVFDAFSRRIVGWRAATTTTTALVLDTWRWRSGLEAATQRQT